MKNWYAVYTKSGLEGESAQRIRSAGIEVFKPLLRRKKYAKTGAHIVSEPLFPCYIFVNFDILQSYRMVAYARGVRYIVSRDNPIKVPDGVIETMKCSMKDGAVEIEACEFTGGQRVVIADGPFRGINGIFQHYSKGMDRSVMLLKALQSSVELDSFLLKPDNP